MKFRCCQSISVTLILALLTCLAGGCTDPPEGDQPFDKDQYCQLWCAEMQGCGLIGYDAQHCTEICDADFDDRFLAECAHCLEETACEDSWTQCFDDHAPCHRDPTTSYLVNTGGFGEELEGRMVYGQLTTYGGVPLGVFDEGEITGGNVSLTFGTVLSPGLHYLFDYYVDVDEDGVCDPGIDDAYRHEVIGEANSTVIYGIPNIPDETTPAVCEGFTSIDELCRLRCEHLELCAELTEPLSTCEDDCVESLSPSFLEPCVTCLDNFSCEEIGDACLQTGGVCDEEHVPPETEFLFSGSGFSDYDGLDVYAEVQDLSGQVLTPVLKDTIEEGGFFLHFGESVWMNQIYVTVFFIDVDDTGSCAPTDPGWAIEVEVEESILHYQLHEHAPEEEMDVCELISN